MNGKMLIGRKAERERLEKCLQADQAQLIIVYGRRRVGKTFLINRYFDGRFDFKLTGAYAEPRETQLRYFSAELNRQTGEEKTAPKDWIEAFQQLREYLTSLPREEKHVVFFDEMPWMDTQRSGFLSAFEWFWNDWGCTQDNLIFIVCGSATSWMVENIAENKGGLFNRQTCRLYLQPFTLRETELYLQARGIEWSRRDIAECYMILGGIPYYLSLLDEGLSFNANIDNLFFRKRAELWDEFDHLYKTLFSNSEQYIKIVEQLSKKRMGLTRSEIVQQTKLPANGALSKMLNDLSDSGFVRKYSFYGKKSKETLYQLSDYYTLFYYRFIKGGFGKDEHFWSNTLDNPARRAWEGITFEQLCKDHIPQIKQKLGIAGVLSEESSWFGTMQGDTEESKTGAQIDLIIDRRDQVINLCEVKFSLNRFEINKDYDQNLRNKIAVFREATNCRKTIQLSMITTFGVQKNKYSGIVSNEVLLDDLFREP